MARDVSPLSLMPFTASHQRWVGASLGFILPTFPLRSLIFYYFLSCAAATGSLPGMDHDYGISPKFVCTPIPPEADPSCYSPPGVPHGQSSSGHSSDHGGGSRRGVMSDEAKATILHLRESLVRQKETILDQRETIRELTAKLTLCEGFGGHHSTGHHDSHHENRHDSHHDTHHDTHHDNHHDDHHGHHGGHQTSSSSSSSSHHGPFHGTDHHYSHGSHRSDTHHRKGSSYGKHTSFSPEQTGKTLQTLKERLENLQARNSSSSYSSSLRELLQRKIAALEEQLHSYYRDHHDDRHDSHHDDHHDDNHDEHHADPRGSTHPDDHHDDHHDDRRTDHYGEHHNNHRNNHHGSSRYNPRTGHQARHYSHHYDSHHSRHDGHYGNRHSDHHNDHHDDHDDHHDDHHDPHDDHHDYHDDHHDDHHGNGHHDDHHDYHQGAGYHDDHHGDHHDSQHYDSHHDDHPPRRPPSSGKETSPQGHSKLETVLSQLHHATGDHGNHKKLKSPSAFLLDFPMRTNYMYARMKRPVISELFALTICLWMKAGEGPGMGTPISYAVPGQANELVLIEWGSNPMELLINDKAVTLPITMTDGKWHHVCVTWSTREGVWEAYQDGVIKGSGQNLSAWHSVKPGGTFILGQEQDTMGGRFDVTQSFMGELSDLQFWSRVLTANEIYGQATCGGHLTGDIMSWSEEAVELHGGLTEFAFDPCH